MGEWKEGRIKMDDPNYERIMNHEVEGKSQATMDQFFFAQNWVLTTVNNTNLYFRKYRKPESIG